MRSITPVWLTAIVVLAAAGCGEPAASISGAVTYDGQPVGRGWVTFAPTDGVGPVVGGPITGGRYSVAGLPPGRKVVQVVAVKAVPFARSSEEMARRAAENKAKGDGSGLIDPADEIPADADGNNATHEIKPGAQTLDLHLKPSRRANS
jgi:hypothetical protein